MSSGNPYEWNRESENTGYPQNAGPNNVNNPYYSQQESTKGSPEQAKSTSLGTPVLIAGIAIALIGVVSLVGAFTISVDASAASSADNVDNEVAANDALVREGVAPEDARELENIMAHFPPEIYNSVYDCGSFEHRGTICRITSGTKLGTYFSVRDEGAVMDFSADAKTAVKVESDNYQAAKKGLPNSKLLTSGDRTRSAFIQCDADGAPCEINFADTDANLTMHSLWFGSKHQALAFLGDYGLIE